MKHLTLSLVSLSLLALAMPALGDDFAPPPWRGQPLSCMAEWEFSTLPSNWYYVTPETEQAVGDGIHELYPGSWFTNHASFAHPDEWAWSPGDGDGKITSLVGNDVTFVIPNFMDNEPEKLVHIQMTWSGAFAPTIVDVGGYIGYLPDRVFYQGTLMGTVGVDPTHIVSQWQIVPNPWWEYIAINVPAGTALDQVVIDTISPEPATLALLALGGMALLRRHRR